MNRRAFLSALASLPLVGRIFQKSYLPVLYGEMSDDPSQYVKFKIANHPVIDVHEIYIRSDRG